MNGKKKKKDFLEGNDGNERNDELPYLPYLPTMIETQSIYLSSARMHASPKTPKKPYQAPPPPRSPPAESPQEREKKQRERTFRLVIRANRGFFFLLFFERVVLGGARGGPGIGKGGRRDI